MTTFSLLNEGEMWVFELKKGVISNIKFKRDKREWKRIKHIINLPLAL